MLKHYKTYKRDAKYHHVGGTYTVKFTGELEKDKMFEPLYVEYDFKPDPRQKGQPCFVEEWTAEEPRERLKELFEWIIDEVDGNKVKAHFKLLKEEGWSADLNNPEVMNLNFNLYANIKVEVPIEFVSSKTSKVYHKCICGYARKIKNPTDNIEGKRTCKRCF